MGDNMNILEKIKELPEATEGVSPRTLVPFILRKVPDDESIYRTNDPSKYPICSTNDLKRLASDHERLLAAAKEVQACVGDAVSGNEGDVDFTRAINSINLAVEACEKK